jgi:hypothetical protein
VPKNIDQRVGGKLTVRAILHQGTQVVGYKERRISVALGNSLALLSLA